MTCLCIQSKHTTLRYVYICCRHVRVPPSSKYRFTGLSIETHAPMHLCALVTLLNRGRQPFYPGHHLVGTFVLCDMPWSAVLLIKFGSHKAFLRQIDPFMTYDPRWGRFENMPTNLMGLSPTPMPTFSLIPQSRSASILELPKMTPRWPVTPNSWIPLLSPPPTNLMIIVMKYSKNPSRHIREEAFYDFGHTDRYTHVISSLNSLFPPLLYPLINYDAGATTVTTYLLIENYTFYRKTYISHLLYTLHHYQTTWTSWTWVFWIYLFCTTAFSKQ